MKFRLPQHVDCLRFDRDGLSDVVGGVGFFDTLPTVARLHGGLRGDDVVVDRFKRCVFVLFRCACPAGFWGNRHQSVLQDRHQLHKDAALAWLVVSDKEIVNVQPPTLSKIGMPDMNRNSNSLSCFVANMSSAQDL